MHLKFKLLIAALIGALALILIRLLFMPANLATHYHANFAVFVNGEMLDLSADKFMEDVEGCKPGYVPLQPEERVHMHNNDDEVVHIHNDGVTWGHFFQNLGFTLSDASITTDEGVTYSNQSGRTLKFIVNGVQDDAIANQLIGNEDQVLISYGPESVEEILETQVPQLEENASYHNEHPDPGSCSGNIDAGWVTRLRKAIWF